MPFDEIEQDQDETAIQPWRLGYRMPDEEGSESQPSIGMRIMQMAPPQARPDAPGPLRGIDAFQQAAQGDPQPEPTPSIGQRIMQIGRLGVPLFDIQDGRPVWRQDPQTPQKPSIGQRIMRGATSETQGSMPSTGYDLSSWETRPETARNAGQSKTFMPQLGQGLSRSNSSRPEPFGQTYQHPESMSSPTPEADKETLQQPAAFSANASREGSAKAGGPEFLRGPLDFNEFASFVGGGQVGSAEPRQKIYTNDANQSPAQYPKDISAGVSGDGTRTDPTSSTVKQSAVHVPASSSKNLDKTLQVPQLKGTVGGPGAKNDPEDVAKIQGYLNAIVRDGQLPSFTELKVTGKVDDVMLRMIYEYQKQAHLLPSPHTTPAGVMIEPRKGTITQLAKHPFIDKRWSRYDDSIKTEVAKYNQFFSKYPGFTPLDWRWVKAMIWGRELKAGPDQQEGKWWTRPMQIGNPGDPALAQLKAGKEGSAIFVDKDLLKQLKTQAVVGDLNIKAGIAWLYTKLIKSIKHTSVVDNPAIKKYYLRPGQSLESLVQKTHGKQILKTTLEELYNQNELNESKARSLRPGWLKYREAHDTEEIELLNDWDTATQNYHRRVPKPDEPPYLPEIKEAYERIKKNWPQ